MALGDTSVDIRKLWKRDPLIYVSPDLCVPVFALMRPELRCDREHILESANSCPGDYTVRVTEEPEVFPPFDFMKSCAAVRRTPKEKILLATSIAPRKIAEQKRAVDTWLIQGFDVISVNHEHEIEQLSPQFPDVRFTEVKDTSLLRQGIYKIYVDELFRALAEFGNPYDACGIINSDISLYDLSTGKIAAACREGLFVSQRFDLPENAVYHAGIDVFFMNNAFVEAIGGRKTEFIFGEPFWDYYVPLFAMARGVRVYKAIPPLGCHFEHPTGWDSESWFRQGESFCAFFYENIASLPVADGEKIKELIPSPCAITRQAMEHVANLFFFIYANQPFHINALQPFPVGQPLHARRRSFPGSLLQHIKNIWL